MNLVEIDHALRKAYDCREWPTSSKPACVTRRLNGFRPDRSHLDTRLRRAAAATRPTLWSSNQSRTIPRRGPPARLLRL